MRTQGKLVAVLALIVATSIAQAQVYKCKTTDGKTIYQQRACSAAKNESGDEVRIWAQPPPDQIAEAQVKLQAQKLDKAQAEYDNALLNSARVDSEVYQAMPSAGQSLNTAPTSNGPCPLGQVPLNASRSDPTRGWSGARGYVPLRCGFPGVAGNTRATKIGPGVIEPRRIQDQQGNWYSQPPGSAFATDEKTGKQCFVYGDFVRCD